MRNKPLPGLMKKSPVTLRVDSTPVGQKKANAAGYGFSAAIDAGSDNASMWKSERDRIATNKVQQENIELSRSSKPGSGGMSMIMPGE